LFFWILQGDVKNNIVENLFKKQNCASNHSKVSFDVFTCVYCNCIGQSLNQYFKYYKIHM
jgi:hypothetical protein